VYVFVNSILRVFVVGISSKQHGFWTMIMAAAAARMKRTKRVRGVDVAAIHICRPTSQPARNNNAE
jgi:hypothetical protein